MNDKSTFGIGRLYEAKEYRRKLEDDDQKRCVLYSCFVLLAYTNTTNPSATAMEKTLFGTILSSSCAPSNQPGPIESSQLFENPSRMTQADVELAEQMAFSNSALIIDCMSKLFLKLCQLSPRTRHLLLLWVGRLLHANNGRIKLASIMSSHNAPPRDECSDGLMLNLCAVLLRLCKPFSLPQSPKLMRIHPQYCRQRFSESNDQEAKHHHLWGVSEETYLVQLDENQVNTIEMPSEYNFICDIFFLTHQSLHLGLHSTFERFANLNRDLNRIQTAYQQLQAAGSPDVEAIKLMFEGAMKRFMCMRVALVDPELLKPVLQFHVATSTYLTHLATGGDNSVPFSSLTFPLKEPNTRLLGCIPEHIITNITDAMSEVIHVAEHFMDLILVFMGSKSRLKNPHLRAKLAEVLYEIMPSQEQDTYAMSRLNSHNVLKERLFKEHRNVDRLAEVLFDVFVGIEITGDSVEFEQKLSYRQPMYKVIDYIWKIDLHRKAVAKLSDAALADIENTDPPLFLRFVNLLVNDARFLLDEALGFMKQIREKESERDSSSSTLRGRELEQFEADLAQIINISRFYNSAAVDTTHTLALLTSNCSELFCHSIMVDRICAMLNYFLLMLTGPKMKEFKVKDFDKSEFKPSVVVSEICQIYLNLSHSAEFCQAVSADGRSYSPQLFPQTERVLKKINKPSDMIQAFNSLGVHIKNAAVQQMEDDELSSSAPEEFLDALLNTMMKDPVILPSSKQRVDRSTIARHILSDQTDPFDRSPLTLDQIIPDTELKSKIFTWLQEQRNKL
ncbi:ubiquitin conjugation factor E4 A-like [Watersipora subatra]|uniref:ubiquitin conjugation factor E4 A-like n=1 Tax=Watersipora subatra TaxID=2589382 RepID=UPI00355B54E2